MIPRVHGLFRHQVTDQVLAPPGRRGRPLPYFVDGNSTQPDLGDNNLTRPHTSPKLPYRNSAPLAQLFVAIFFVTILGLVDKLNQTNSINWQALGQSLGPPWNRVVLTDQFAPKIIAHLLVIAFFYLSLSVSIALIDDRRGRKLLGSGMVIFCRRLLMYIAWSSVAISLYFISQVDYTYLSTQFKINGEPVILALPTLLGLLFFGIGCNTLVFKPLQGHFPRWLMVIATLAPLITAIGLLVNLDRLLHTGSRPWYGTFPDTVVVQVTLFAFEIGIGLTFLEALCGDYVDISRLISQRQFVPTMLASLRGLTHLALIVPPLIGIKLALLGISVPAASVILDRNGQVLEYYHPAGYFRVIVPPDNVSSPASLGLDAIEDSGLVSSPFTHSPVSPIRLAGIISSMPEGNTSADVGGGSGVAAQVCKNVSGRQERQMTNYGLPKTLPKRDHFVTGATATEKLLFEFPCAWGFERAALWFGAPELKPAHQYLNLVNFGNGAYGIEAGALTYFGKSAKDLTLSEAALLVGLPQALGDLDPWENPQAAKVRRNAVLKAMARNGYISEKEAAEASAQPLGILQAPYNPPKYADSFIKGYLMDELDRQGFRHMSTDGLRVMTSLDLNLQREATAIIQKKLSSDNYRQRNARDAALVALNPSTGEILAFAGDMAWKERQPGSSFKPFTYVTALKKGWTAATRIEDKPMSFPDGKGGQWSPTSADGRYWGWVSVRQALAMSLNVPAVLTLQYAGIDQTLDNARQMGITTLPGKASDYGLALTLGSGEVKLLDLVFAYSVFANNGIQNGQSRPNLQIWSQTRPLDPIGILRIEGRSGKVIREFKNPQSVETIPAPYAYLITDILSDNSARSQAFREPSALLLPDNRPAAVKTGTNGISNKTWDLWTVGYTPELVAGVWVGNRERDAMSEARSDLLAAPIWNEFMTKALDGIPASKFKRPDGLIDLRICQSTGLPASQSNCRDEINELFIRGTEPKAK